MDNGDDEPLLLVLKFEVYVMTLLADDGDGENAFVDDDDDDDRKHSDSARRMNLDEKSCRRRDNRLLLLLWLICLDLEFDAKSRSWGAAMLQEADAGCMGYDCWSIVQQ